MALTNLEVVRVVGRRNLHHPSPKVRRHVIVGNDFDFAVNQRHHYMLADQFLVAFVAWIHGDGFVTKHRFWPGGGDFNVVLAVEGRPVGERVLDVVKGALIVLVFDFDVG